MPTAFKGTHSHKIEPRGRVSIPAEFRKILRDAEVNDIILVPQLRDDRCHMFFTERGLDAYYRSFDVDELDADQQRALDDIIFGDARKLSIDDLGRIVIPEEYRESINVTNECVFVGAGSYFEMWEPKTRAEHRARQREAVRPVVARKRMTDLPI